MRSKVPKEREAKQEHRTIEIILGEVVSARVCGLSVVFSVDHRDVGSTWYREEQGDPATAEEEAGCWGNTRRSKTYAAS